MAEIHISSYEDPAVMRDVADLLTKWADAHTPFTAGSAENQPAPIIESPPEPTPTAEPLGIPEEQYAAPELDAAGIPWDERIHAGSRKKNADGSWKKRRGVDDETVKAVMDELRQHMTPSGFTSGECEQQHDMETGTAEAKDVFGTSPAPAAPPAQAPAAPPAQAPAAPPAQAPAAPPVPPAPPSMPEGSGLQWPMVLSAISSAEQAGKITKENISAVLGMHDIAALPLLIQRPDRWQQVLLGLGLEVPA